MRSHGKSKRRTWRNLHLSVNPDARKIVAEVLTENNCHDADAVPELLAQVQQPVGTFYGDGSYDKWKVYDGLAERQIQPVIPPHTMRRSNSMATARRHRCHGMKRFGRFVEPAVVAGSKKWAVIAEA